MLPVKPFFFAREKKWKSAREIMRVEKPKKPEKSARENEILPVKKRKNGFHAHFFFTRTKKNTGINILEIKQFQLTSP